MKNLMQTRLCFLIFWKIPTNHYEIIAQITINYQSLHNCLTSNQIMGWVGLVITKLLNEREVFYLKRTSWKRTFMLLNPWWNSSVWDIRKLTCVQISVCCTLKIQSWPSAKHVDILIINPWLAGEKLLSHT